MKIVIGWKAKMGSDKKKAGNVSGRYG